MTALDEQIGGSHYKKYPIQPWVFNKINDIPSTEAHIIEYICRWKDKGGVQDLRKIKQYCDMLIEHEEKIEEIKSLDVCQTCFDKHLVAKTFGYAFITCECKCHEEKSEAYAKSLIDRASQRSEQCESCFHYPRKLMLYSCACKCHKETKDAG